MNDIYIDPSAAGAPDAGGQLQHLVETGHRVMLVGDVRGIPTGLGDELRLGIVAAVPDDAARGSWFITADPATCSDRRPGVRTLLVGPRPAPSPRPTPRCDAEARDLASAVLEILRLDVMG